MQGFCHLIWTSTVPFVLQNPQDDTLIPVEQNKFLIKKSLRDDKVIKNIANICSGKK
jgi:hypothetical protein